jgi:hypothetical protein
VSKNSIEQMGVKPSESKRGLAVTESRECTQAAATWRCIENLALFPVILIFVLFDLDTG